MHSTILDWVRGKRANLRSKWAKTRQPQDEPKLLSPPWACRTGVLTPTSSSTDLHGSRPAATADCAFFQRLPPEIRRKILAMAFGNRTMHMSLEFNHPRQLVRRPTNQGGLLHRSNDGGSQWGRYISPTTRQPPRRLELDKQVPKAWHWRGCPCWNNIEPGYPHSDGCQPGVARCWKKASDVLDCCLIGSIGWLLTCRQAYVEGIEVLYGTNTFHLSNKHSVVIYHLQNLLPSSRLSTIASIELSLNINDLMGNLPDVDGDSPVTRDAGRSSFLAMLEAIPRALPRLRTVRIDIHGYLFWGLPLEEAPPYYEKHLFEPIDDMVRKLGPQLKEFLLVVPYTIAQKSESRARSEGWKFRREGWGAIFWRPLSSSNINSETQPRPEVEAAVEGSGEPGYWITRGYFDDPYPLMGCFGTGSSDPDRHDAINAELHSWTDKDKALLKTA